MQYIMILEEKCVRYFAYYNQRGWGGGGGGGDSDAFLSLPENVVTKLS